MASLEPLPFIAIKVCLFVGALAWALQQKPEADLKFYFHVQWIATLCIYGVLLFHPKSAIPFYAVYSAATAFILFAAVWITVRRIIGQESEVWLLLLGLVAGGGMAYVSIEGVPGPRYFVDWVHIVEGTFLVGLAAMLGMGSKQATASLLSFGWLSLGLFRLLFRLHWDSAAWNRANEAVPWMIVLLTVAAIGWQLSSSKAMACRDR